MSPRPRVKGTPGVKRQLARAQKKIDALESENAVLRVRLSKQQSGEGLHPRDEPSGVDPRNIVWILGSGRTGSSWLAFMLEDLEGFTRWNEPLVGYLFGQLIGKRAPHRREKKHFILSRNYDRVWLNSMRSLILDGANARFPELTQGDGFLVIKEPHSARSAPLLMKSLPESRMIFLVRDPRDTVASALSWSLVRDRGGHPDHEAMARRIEADTDAFVKWRSLDYSKDIEAAATAFEEHTGPRTFVRYEDLRSDTLEEMQRMLTELRIPFGPERLSEVVNTHSWENIPEKDKGEGKIRRKATPGGWNDDLTESQVADIEDICAPVFERFYPGVVR